MAVIRDVKRLCVQCDSVPLLWLDDIYSNYTALMVCDGVNCQLSRPWACLWVIILIALTEMGNLPMWVVAFPGWGLGLSGERCWAAQHTSCSLLLDYDTMWPVLSSSGPLGLPCLMGCALALNCKSKGTLSSLVCFYQGRVCHSTRKVTAVWWLLTSLTSCWYSMYLERGG